MTEYQCRTKKITCRRFYISFLKDGIVKISTSEETKEEAEKHGERMTAAMKGYTFEIKEKVWEEEVCIECGNEKW